VYTPDAFALRPCPADAGWLQDLLQVRQARPLVTGVHGAHSVCLTAFKKPSHSFLTRTNTDFTAGAAGRVGAVNLQRSERGTTRSRRRYYYSSSCWADSCARHC